MMTEKKMKSICRDCGIILKKRFFGNSEMNEFSDGSYLCRPCRVIDFEKRMVEAKNENDNIRKR